MVKSFKKVFSTFVSLTTIAWSVGAGTLALPGVASAATLSAGDLIKASGPAVYFYAADGKRYVFPNEKTYWSWFQNFGAVKMISDTDLAAITIGGNVVERAGTKLVKITTDPKVYAVTNYGVLHWIQSEAIAMALYGSNWAQRVIDVPDAFFTNYSVGSSVSTNVHPDGTLIKYAGDATIYVVMNGAKRKFASDAAFAANGFNMNDVITTTIVYGNGADVTGRESVLADVVSASSTPVGGSLTVSLASDTPAGQTVTNNASSQKLVKVNLMAGSADAMVTGMRFMRAGVGATSDFSNVYLYDGDGNRLTTGRTINTTTNIVEFNSLSLTVPAGMTKSVYVYGDFSGPSSTGGEHSFQLTDAASVVVTGNGTVSGNFPVRGNVFVVGTTASARVDLQKGILPANPNIGAKNVEISNFKITANTNDIEVNQVTLYQAGSVTNSDLTNFQLMQGATVVATAAAVSNNGHIVLKFATPYVIGNGTTKVFSLHADVAGRAGRTIRTYVEYTTDVSAIDKKFNSGASICINTSSPCSGSSANFDGTSSNYIEVTTQGGQLTNAFNGPATTNVAKGQLSVPLYKFSLTSPDNTLEIKKVVFTVAKTAGSLGTCAVIGTSGTHYFRSLKIKNLDTGVTVMGPQEMTGANAVTTATLTYNDSFNITAGQTLNLALVADLSNSEDSPDTYLDGACAYQASFTAFGANDVRVVSTGEFLDITKIVPNTSVTGNALTVKASSLGISLSSSPVSGTLVKKQQNVAIAGLSLTASAQSDITLTNLTLAGQAALATSGCAFGAGSCAAANFAQRVTSLALYDGVTQVGQAKAPDTTSGKAQITNMNLVIPKGTTKNLTVMASFSSSASTTSPFDKVAVGIAAAADAQVQDQDSNTVTPAIDAAVTGQATGAAPSVVQTIRNSGTVTFQADSHPVSNIVVGGKGVWVPMAQYKATAQYEDVLIDRIAVNASSTAGLFADNADFISVAIASNSVVKGSNTFSSGATGTKDIDLGANPITVPKGGQVTFQIWGMMNGTTPSSTASGATTGVARSGHAPAVGIQSGLTTVEWDANYTSNLNIRSTGAASGERVYAAAAGLSNGNSMILRKTQPIVTKQALSSATLTSGNKDLFAFQVAADTMSDGAGHAIAGSLNWKQIIFQYSKTGSTSLANFRLRLGGNDEDIAKYSVTSDAGVDLQAGTLAAASTTGYVIVSYKPGYEANVTGSGNVYTLYASVTTAASQNVTFSFYRDASAPKVTGYLSNGTVGIVTTANASVFNINTGSAAQQIATGAPSATAHYVGSFVWSDNSENPHSNALGTAGGSMDWTNDVYVQDLTQSQTLSI